ncbi:unnamed protein product, partial [Mesorhabditis spiculigera]
MGSLSAFQIPASVQQLIAGDYDDSSAKPENLQKPSSQQRLEKLAVPKSYELTLKVNLPGYGVDFDEKEVLKTTGCVEISISIPKATSYIELHAKTLTFHRAALKNGDGERVLHAESDTEGKVALSDGKEIPAGDYTLTIIYTGAVSSGLGGLYQAHFKGRNGEDRVLATTQMCPMDARTMVPCFDEPAFKCEWKLSILHPHKSRAISNGSEDAVVDAVPGLSGWKLTSFERTPRMSSYLLALVICDFTPIQGHTNRGTQFRIFTQEGMGNQAKFALEAGIRCLECYEHLFGIPFPLKKQDMIAIPDFSFGAMENWGLVTYRETMLLFDDNVGTSFEKDRVASIVAHELAHQWFGNLVTMEYWDDVWLNEGFATFVQYFGLHAVDAGFRNWETFLGNTQNIAFDVDSLASAHPLSFKADSLQKIEESFDALTYKKGASVIKMLWHTLSHEKFLEGLQNYLRKYSYSNATSDQLWAEFASVGRGDYGGISFVELARQWTSQIGYPLITVDRVGEGHFELSQHRFYLSKTLNPKYPQDSFETQWHIPLFYSADGKEHFAVLAPNQKLRVDTTDGRFPIVNIEGRSFCRVTYGVDGWAQIKQRIQKGELDTLTRSRIINDVFACARQGAVPYAVALGFDDLLSGEKESVPMRQLLNGLLSVYQRFPGEQQVQGHIQKVLNRVLGPLQKEISLDDVAKLDREIATAFQSQYATRLVEAECELNRAECTGRYVDAYRHGVLETTADGKMASQASRVGPILRNLVYNTAIYGGNDEDYEKTWNLYMREANQSERVKLLTALCYSKDLEKARTLLRKSVDVGSRDIRQQDIKIVFGAFTENPAVAPKLLDLFFEEYDFIYKNLSTSSRELNDVVMGSLEWLTREQVEKVKSFLTAHPEVREIGSFEKQLIATATKLEWKDKFGGQVADYYAKKAAEIQ